MKQIKFCISFSIIVFLLAVSFSAVSLDLPLCSPWATSTIEAGNLNALFPEDFYRTDFTSSISRLDMATLAVRAYENATGENAPSADIGFSDTLSHEASCVRYLGIMSGKGNDLFDPYAPVTREEAAKIILSLKCVIDGTPALSDMSPVPPFGDYFSASDWAKPYIARISELGIMQGNNDGLFSPFDNVTYEEAATLILRSVALPVKARPTITSVSWDGVVSSDEPFSVTVEGEGSYVLYEKMADHDSEKYLLSGVCGITSVVPGGTLDENSVHYLYAVADNGVYSAPIRVYTDSYSICMDGSFDRISETMQISWNMIPTADIYTVSVTESRRSVGSGRIPQGETRVYELANTGSLSFKAYGNCVYNVEIIGGDCYTEKNFYTECAYDNSLASAIRGSYPQTEEQAKQMVITVTVPVWRLKNGFKVPGTSELTVHYLLAEKIVAVFNDIFNGEEQFPINSLGGYSWRGRRSEHNGGTAIDINSNENYCIYANGTVVGSYWKPYEDVFSITPYGDVVRAFERHGFAWGGDAWGEGGTIDYMHFSYLGT